MFLLLYRNFVDIVFFKYSFYKIKDLVLFVIIKNCKKKVLYMFLKSYMMIFI